MTCSDFFGYQVSENGRLVLPGLTEVETLEFELLNLQDPHRRSHRSELRHLELYLKQHGARTAQGGQAKTPAAPTPPIEFRPAFHRLPPARVDRPLRLDQRAAASVFLIGAGLVGILLVALSI